MSEPYDPYLPKDDSPYLPRDDHGVPPDVRGESSKGAPGTSIKDIQDQINHTVVTMRDNVTRVAERGERLDALHDKTDKLSDSAQQFRRGANRVRKNMWWKDMKMRIIIGAAIAVIIIIIVVSVVKATQDHH